MGFIESNEVLTIFLFVYLHLGEKPALVQLINYQLCNLLLSLELKNHMLEINGHLTPELLICVLDDLSASNLA